MEVEEAPAAQHSPAPQQPAPAPAATPAAAQPAPEEPMCVGAGGGAPEASTVAFSHYADPVPQPEDPELAPPVPAERPDLPQEDLDASLEGMSETLAKPDPKEVSKVVTSIVAMSDAQRTEAMSQLSDDEFDAMMDNLPPGEHERLNELVAATKDPKRKLRVWSAAEQAELGREGRNLENVPHSTDHPGDEEALLARRIAATREGREEVEDEVAVATEALEDPSLDDDERAEMVEELIKRKEKEREIEREFGVNLTNDKGGTAGNGMPTPRATWSSDELDDMAVVLERLPDSAIQENPDLREIRRREMDYDRNPETGKWEEKPKVGGEHENGAIQIFDKSLRDDRKSGRDSSEIAGMDRVSRIQHNFAHEAGHNELHRNPEAAKKVMEAAGWKNEKGADAKAKAEACKDGGVAPDGRMYVMDDKGVVSSYDPELLPEGGAHSRGNRNPNHPDTWDYARTDPEEYFTEMYAKGVTTPELLYEDLVSGPAARVKALQEGGASQAEIDEAIRVQKSKAAQHQTMRTEVFHLDEAQVESNAAALHERADEMGLDDEQRKRLIDGYNAAAAQAMTPEQLDAIYAGYEDSIYEM